MKTSRMSREKWIRPGDIETINLELVLADLETVEKRLDRVARIKKSGDKEAVLEFDILTRLKEALAEGKPAARWNWTRMRKK